MFFKPVLDNITHVSNFLVFKPGTCPTKVSYIVIESCVNITLYDLIPWCLRNTMYRVINVRVRQSMLFVIKFCWYIAVEGRGVKCHIIP